MDRQQSKTHHRYGKWFYAAFPSVGELLEGLFGSQGVYRYMHDVLAQQSDSFEIIPVEINAEHIITRKYKSFTLQFINVHHGIVPALAVVILVDGKKIVISGDTNDENENLEKIALNADIFIAHLAIPEDANSFAKTLHMQPSTIAKIAEKSHVKQLILSHIMNRTQNKKDESFKIIQKIYKGKVIFAQDNLRLKP